MPSPVAHSIVGLSFALAWLVRPAASIRAIFSAAAQNKTKLLGLLILASAPDVDYLIGIPYGNFNLFHQIYSHTIAWVTGAAFLAWLLWREPRREARGRLFVFLWLVAASHLLMDYFTDDGSYPYGIMVVWPFNNGYFTSASHLFPRMMKLSWKEIFQAGNLSVMLCEIFVVLPLLLIVVDWKLWKGRRLLKRLPENTHAT